MVGDSQHACVQTLDRGSFTCNLPVGHRTGSPERNDGERAMHLVKRVSGSQGHDSVAIRMYSSQTSWHMSLILRRYPALEQGKRGRNSILMLHSVCNSTHRSRVVERSSNCSS